MRVLIIGLGSVGRRHLANLRALGVTDLIAYRSGARTTTEADNAVVYFSDLDEALSQRPDVAIIANPTHLHVPTALSVAKAGIPFFLEKPLSHSLDGLDSLLEQVRRKRLLTLIGFNMRFHPTLLTAERLMSEGRIGRVLYVRAEVGQYLPDWRPGQDYRRGYGARKESGGGVVLDLIHEMDYTTWLAGPLTSLTCVVAKVSDLEIETEDVAELTMHFASGALGSIHLDYIQRVPHRACRIVGDAGTITCDLLACEARLFDTRRGEWELFSEPSFQRNDMYLAEMRHLLECLGGREKPRVDLESAMGVHSMTLAALELARAD